MIRTVATKWKRLALELGFELSMIESIGNRYSDSEEDCEAMLRKWLLRPDATVSWEALMTALDNIGLNSIAQDLEKGIVMYLDHFLTGIRSYVFGPFSDSTVPPGHFSPVLHDCTVLG